jgi:glutamyl-tRNA synthetase
MQLFEALEREPPAFGHHSLLIGADGQVLSKRLGALSIQGLREAGLEPMALASYTALIGTSDSIEPHASLDELAELFAFDKISMAPARFDVEELKALNARLCQAPIAVGSGSARSALAAVRRSGWRCAATSPCSAMRRAGGASSTVR